jgi:hypothetical protein
MAAPIKYPVAFQKYLVSFLEKNDVPGTAATKGSGSKATRNRLNDVSEKHRDKVAHFWDSSHQFWKDNPKYEVTSAVPLPAQYTSLGIWKVSHKGRSEDNNDSENQLLGPTMAEYEKKELRMDRERLLLSYEKEVYTAQQKVEQVESILTENPTLSTQSELDDKLKEAAQKIVNVAT